MRFAATAVLLLFAATPSAQTPETPAFDVASIKPHPTTEQAYSLNATLGRLTATNITLRQLVQFAYRPLPTRLFLENQIIGGPAWTNTERFDIEAKAASAGPVPLDQVLRMTEALLEERFHLKTHREMREAPVYALVQASSGIKMKMSQTQELPRRDGTPRRFDPSGVQPIGTIVFAPAQPGDAALSGSAAAMVMLVSVLQGFADRPIVDETGLKGLFDFRLEFAKPSLPAAAAGASDLPPALDGATGAHLFTAIQEQLGLKLEPKKGAVDVLIIDGAERPGEN
jgi:uncharacterized protein (TIGR03435 family)